MRFSTNLFLPVDRNGDGHVDGGGHEGVGGRVEERHQDGVRAPLVDLKKQNVGLMRV